MMFMAAKPATASARISRDSSGIAAVGLGVEQMAA